MLDQFARLEAATATIHAMIRVAGVVTSCTWSADKGLFDGWRRLANRRILQLQGKSE